MAEPRGTNRSEHSASAIKIEELPTASKAEGVGLLDAQEISALSHLELDPSEKDDESEVEEIFPGLPGSTDIVIIENGSYTVKADTADKKAPSLEWRCLLGKEKDNIDSKEMFLPHDVEMGKWDDYTFKCPMDPLGRLQEKQVSKMGNLWGSILKNVCQQDRSELSVMLTEPSYDLDGMNAAQNIREKMITIIMSFNVASCYIANDAQLALFSTGETSGTVVDMGHSMTYITPIFEGHVLTQGVQISQMAGKLASVFLKSCYPSTDWSKYRNQKHLMTIKENHCFVNPSILEIGSLAGLASGSRECKVESYQLPDNSNIELKSEILSQVPEIFFNPNIKKNLFISDPDMAGANGTQGGINDIVSNAVLATPAKIRGKVSNLVLCGGSSMFQGMVPRWENVLADKAMLPNGEEINLTLTAKPYRKYATWIGGSILANLEEFKSKWITQDIYQEEGGYRCVHKRVFW